MRPRIAASPTRRKIVFRGTAQKRNEDRSYAPRGTDAAARSHTTPFATPYGPCPAGGIIARDSGYAHGIRMQDGGRRPAVFAVEKRPEYSVRQHRGVLPAIAETERTLPYPGSPVRSTQTRIRSRSAFGETFRRTTSR